MTFIIPEQMLFFFFLSRIPEPDLVNCLIRIFRTHKYRICVKNNSYKARNLGRKELITFLRKLVISSKWIKRSKVAASRKKQRETARLLRKEEGSMALFMEQSMQLQQLKAYRDNIYLNITN